MSIAVFCYRCRRCGEARDADRLLPPTSHVRDWIQVECYLRIDTHAARVGQLHDCPDGGYGLSDLIGVDIRER